MEEILKTMLIDLAEREVAEDNEDFLVVDYVGSNVDDAYSLGFGAGEVILARHILNTLCIKYKNPVVN